MGKKEKTRFFDFVLYIGLAIAVLGIVLGGAFYTAHYGITPDKISIPIGIFLVTLVMFGMLIRDYYAHLKTARMWWTISSMFVVHLVAIGFLLYLHLFERRDFLLVLIILVPEYLLLRTFLGKLL